VDSSGNAIAQHASDYRLVTQSDPARGGEWVVVYATNLDYYGLVLGSSGSYQATHIRSNYIGMAPGTMVGQVNLLVPDAFPAPGDLVFQLIKVLSLRLLLHARLRAGVHDRVREHAGKDTGNEVSRTAS
jgi:hypothetical protein